MCEGQEKGHGMGDGEAEELKLMELMECGMGSDGERVCTDKS